MSGPDKVRVVTHPKESTSRTARGEKATVSRSEPRPGARLLTLADVAERLCCSTRHIYNLINAGRLATVDVGLTGSKTRISEDEVGRYIDRSTTTAGRAS